MADHVATMELIDFTPCPPRVRPTTMFTKEEVEAIEKEAYERGKKEAFLQANEDIRKTLERIDSASKPHECISDGNVYTSLPPKYKCKICGEFKTYMTLTSDL